MTFLSGLYSNNMVKCENFESSNLEQFFQQNEVARQRRSAKKSKQPIEQYAHFVALVIDENGVVQFKSSPSLKPQKLYLLEEAYNRLLASMTDVNVADHEDSFEDQMTARYSHHQSPLISAMPKASVSNPFQRPAKRHRSSTIHNFSKDEHISRDEQPDIKALVAQDHKKVEISVCDREAMRRWFGEAFKAVQQVGCRLIAKVWIKKIHPKKQSTHPYNGGYPRNEPADSNRTKPPYWPEGIKHKEPDHIDRNARTALLVHLIMNTPQLQILTCTDPHKQEMISAKDLLKSLEEKKGDFKAERWPIIQHIIQARTFMEQYENGEIVDPNFMICLPDYSDTSRLAQGDSETDILDADEECIETDPGGHQFEDEMREPQVISNSSTLTPNMVNDSNNAFRMMSKNSSSFGDCFVPGLLHQVAQQSTHGNFRNHGIQSNQDLGYLDHLSDPTGVSLMTSKQNTNTNLVNDIVQENNSTQPLTTIDHQELSRNVQQLAVSDWIPTFSSDVFIQHPYDLNHTIGHPIMTLDDQSGFNHGSIHLTDQHQMIGISQNLPILETNDCQNYAMDTRRTLPLRTISTPLPETGAQSSQEMDVIGDPYLTT